MMKNWIILLVFVWMGTVVKASTFEPEISHFTSVKVQGKYNVILQKGDVDKVVIKNDDDNLYDDKIICEVKGTVLSIRLKGDTYKERDLEIIITYTDLKSVTAKKWCNVKIANIMEREEIEFFSEAGAKITAKIKCEKVKATINAGGNIYLDGAVNKAIYKVGAGGLIGGVDLQAKIIIASVTAGGEVICAPLEELSATVTSGGVITYKGEPEKFEQKITFGGKIEKLGN